MAKEKKAVAKLLNIPKELYQSVKSVRGAKAFARAVRRRQQACAHAGHRRGSRCPDCGVRIIGFDCSPA